MIFFCHVTVKFTASLESPYFWVTYSFEGVTLGIRRMTPMMCREEHSLGVEKTEDISHNWPH